MKENIYNYFHVEFSPVFALKLYGGEEIYNLQYLLTVQRCTKSNSKDIFTQIIYENELKTVFLCEYKNLFCVYQLYLKQVNLV